MEEVRIVESVIGKIGNNEMNYLKKETVKKPTRTHCDFTRLKLSISNKNTWSDPNLREIHGQRLRLSKSEVIKRFKEVHGDRYDYSKVEYKNNRTKVVIYFCQNAKSAEKVFSKFSNFFKFFQKSSQNIRDMRKYAS